MSDAAIRGWNERYAGDEYLFGTRPNEYLARHAGLWRPGERVLCVADGEGRNGVFLASRGLAVDAFDPSANALAKSRKLAAERGVALNLVQADCDGFAWPREAYEGIAAIFIQFADPPTRTRLFRNVIAALKPGGHLVLMGYTPKQLRYGTGGPREFDHLYTSAMLHEAFAAMEIVEMVEYEPDLDEGARHSGRSAVIGMIARKG